MHTTLLRKRYPKSQNCYYMKMAHSSDHCILIVLLYLEIIHSIFHSILKLLYYHYIAFMQCTRHCERCQNSNNSSALNYLLLAMPMGTVAMDNMAFYIFLCLELCYYCTSFLPCAGHACTVCTHLISRLPHGNCTCLYVYWT